MWVAPTMGCAAALYLSVARPAALAVAATIWSFGYGLEIDILAELGVFYNRSGLDYTIYVARPLGPVGPLQFEEVRRVAWLTPAEIYELYVKDRLQFGFEMEAVSAYLKWFGSIGGG